MGLFDRRNAPPSGVRALEMQLEQAKAALERNYAVLGRRHYQASQGAAQPEEEALFQAISAGEQEVTAREQAVLAARGLRRCPHCGEVVSMQVLFCNNCGQRVAGEDQVSCPHCRKLIDKKAAFCRHCGAPTSNAQPETPPASAARYCAACGSRVEEADAGFCPNCGAPLPDVPVTPPPVVQPPKGKTCINCGSPMAPGEVFCPECGFGSAQSAVPEPETEFDPEPSTYPVRQESAPSGGAEPERAEPLNNQTRDLAGEEKTKFWPMAEPEELDGPATQIWMPEQERAPEGERVCPQCGYPAAPEERFCSQCGTPVPEDGR